MTEENRQTGNRIILPEQEGIRKLEDEVIYFIGSLRNEKVPFLAKKLRKIGVKEVFDDWFSPGPHADDFWRNYEKTRGSTYSQALNGWAGKHIFEFDSFHIERSTTGVLYMPCGKSGHTELGVMIGRGKKGYVLFDEEPKRWDVMYQYADGIFFNFDDLKEELIKNRSIKNKLYTSLGLPSPFKSS